MTSAFVSFTFCLIADISGRYKGHYTLWLLMVLVRSLFSSNLADSTMTAKVVEDISQCRTTFPAAVKAIRGKWELQPLPSVMDSLWLKSESGAEEARVEPFFFKYIA